MSRGGCRGSRKRESLPGQKLLPGILGHKRKSETHVEDYENDMREMRARQPYRQQQSWEENAGWETSSQSSSLASTSTSNFRRLAVESPFSASRESPFPKFSWADPDEVWNSLCRKDRLYKRNHDYILAHPSLQPRMRAILLDWLVEVCEVYRLHRETYHLALDFVDRYLATQSDIPKQQLQLIGIAALFIAAKIEEIYPPKLNEFAYVTDGACSEAEIMMKELVIMKSLNWELSPATANCWLGIYMQLANALSEKEELESKENSSRMETKQFSSHTFVQAARLLDLCTMDILSLRYTYSAIAASAVYHIVGERVALQCSGYSWEDISSCIYWMAPFALTLREAGPVEIKTFPQISLEDTHNIQTHNVDLSILEAAQSRLTESGASPPSPASVPLGMLTPPQSKNKGRTSVPLSPVNTNTIANAVVLTPSTLNSESPRCSTITSEWNDDAQSAVSYS